MKSAVSREFDEIRAQYEARYLSAWARSDELFDLIRDDRLLSKPIVCRHPFLFYVGHLPAFLGIKFAAVSSNGSRLIRTSTSSFAAALIRMSIPVNVIGIRKFPTSGRH